jgi:hypothetical protein
MVRFAFNPSRAARQKMEELAQSGVSLTLSALLEPRSIKRDSKADSHKQFLHETEVLDLLRVIDGSQQVDNLLGFLDYERIKEGMMCRHMVMVLPYRASCDAMEALIDTHRDQFKNLGGYQIINISGVQGAKRYRSPEQVKKAIAEAEAQGAKTLTLTVNRMLTGSTVEQWDTMLHLKDTSSPQEYDQAIFRLQNQYVRTLYPDPDAASEDAGKPIRENLKPQTLLVDFDPNRLFRMQEQKSLIYNANTEENGNAKLRQRIEEEIRISPIITMNLGRIHRVEATSVLEAVSAYSSQRSIADEAGDIPVDLGVLKNQAILRVIEAQPDFGSKAGLTIGPTEGDKDDLDVPDPDDDAGSGPGKGLGDGATGGEDETVKSLTKKLQTYYERILLFAMLTPSHVKSLSEIVRAMADGDNTRIADHLSLDVETLGLLLSELDPFKLASLDYKIQNISQLVRDDTLDPVERAVRALNKFSRISDSEVRTPSWLCRDMVAAIPGPELVAVITRGEALLDIASKSGEFALALCQRLVGELSVRPETIRDRILSVPTSSISYEFTRRFYEILGLDVGGIATDFTAYDLVGLSEGDAEELLRGDAQFEFGVVIGNPPYQADDGGYGTSAGPIYQRFVELAKNLSPRFVSMVTPSRWFSGGKGLDRFRDEMLRDHRMAMLVDFPKLWEVFPDAKIRGGVSYFVWDRDHDGPCRVETTLDGQPAGGTAERFLDEFDVLVRRNEAVPVLQKVRAKHEATLDGRVSSRKPFGLATNYRGADSCAGMSSPVQLFANQRTAWIERSDIPVNADWVDDWKVLTTAVQGTSAAIETRFLSNPIVAGPGQACTETYLVAGRFGSQKEADRYANYLRTRFVRFLVSLRKPTQHATRDVFAFVPDLPMSHEWAEAALYERYGLSPKDVGFIEATVKPMNAPALEHAHTLRSEAEAAG